MIISCLTPFSVDVAFEIKCIMIYISSSTQLFNKDSRNGQLVRKFSFYSVDRKVRR